MNPQVVIAPFAEPVHLTEMKLHLKMESSVTDDDTLITALIATARDVAETGTGSNVHRQRTMIATTFDYFLDCVPAAYSIKLPRADLLSVTSITYVDDNGDTQTMSSSLYVVDYANSKIDLAYQESWPSTRNQPNAVTVRFVAGMAVPFTAATNDVVTFNGHTFATGDRLRVMNSGGALPTGLAAATDYFVIAGPKVSLTSGGGAVDVTGVGTGTNYAAKSDLIAFETLRTAIKMLVAHWYVNRHAVVAESYSSGAVQLPLAVDAMIQSAHA